MQTCPIGDLPLLLHHPAAVLPPPSTPNPASWWEVAMPPSSSPHLRGSQPDRTGHRPPAPIMVAPNTGPCPGHNPSPHHRSFLFLGWSSVTEGALHTRQDRGKVGSSSCGGEGIGTETGGLLARQRRPGLSRSQGKLSVRAALGMATRWVYSAEIQVLGHLSVPMLADTCLWLLLAPWHQNTRQ